MAAKQSIEIEKLLQWAYCDELIKRTTSSAEGIWDRIEEYGQRGGIDPGHGAAQRYPHFGLPHPDAEAIERAVGALPNFVLDWTASSQAIMGYLQALLAARDMLMVRTLHTAASVTRHAIMRSRPDWRQEAPLPHFIAAERGRNRPKIVGECKGKDRYSIGSYCPLQWEPSPISIAEARADYACWYRGLTTLAETLDLEIYTVLPPIAPALPWSGEKERARKIYMVGEHRKEKPLPLKPDRPIALKMPRRKNPDGKIIDA